MKNLHLRLAARKDAIPLAQLLFDGMEQNPLNNSYVVKSKWTGVKKQVHEIGGDPALYTMFLQREANVMAQAIRDMQDDGRQICVAYEEDSAVLVGCIAVNLVESNVTQDEMIPGTRALDGVIEKFFVKVCDQKPTEAQDIAAFMLNAIKTGMMKIGVQNLKADAPFGVHNVFAENGFQALSSYPKPYDNHMVCNLHPDGSNARLASNRPSLHVWPSSRPR